MAGPGVGWVRVCGSDLQPGEITGVSVEGDDLVAWRSLGGVPHVMEARCPHQWSHLAGEGAVDGEELVCLTHFWRFTGDGDGWKENVSGRRDRKGDIGVRACRELEGGIWIRSPDDCSEQETEV
ncbi:MAG: Rieske (2Fe-2S) protein [Acidimicrobiia bacterium]|nr:Rieske (2Fe-2S) protein [Actinomycetota bacterium]MBL6923787.1 Rieske (2Fe-2S) protein [Acidimicrobiia bacterium]MBL6927479.1 Rieske (2Fe-2S) protein [Acidimicrobiia bacterium]